MCAGCGGLQVLHEIYDILGNKTVFVNAAGCMTLLTIYPFTPFAVPGFIPRWVRRQPALRASGMRWIFYWRKNALQLMKI